MNDKKHIDKLFKEKLKDFEATPEDFIWENIEGRLHQDKRKKRRVIPIWWKVAGIAAGIIFLFTVANQVFNSSETNGISNDVIVDDSNINKDIQPESNSTLPQKSTSEDITKKSSNDENVADVAPENAIDEDEKTSVQKQKNDRIHSDNDKELRIASENSNKTKLKENSDSEKTSGTNKTYNELLEEKSSTIQKPSTKGAVVKNNKDTSKSKTNSEELLKPQSEIKDIIESSKTDNNTTVAKANSGESNNSETKNNAIEDGSQNKEQEEETDNAIENAIAEAEDTDEKEEEEEKLNRWSVSPNVAPVYFSSLGKGSSLDQQFVENTKETEINMSYGVTGSYAINKKLKIRTGINKVQLGYKTNDVLIFENTNPVAQGRRQIANVNLVDSMSQHSIYSARNFKFENAPATLFTQEQGALDQQLGFIEVPIEIEYNLVEKKIGLNLIGGFSTLFLSDNDVYAVLNNGDRTRLGEASNVKDLSYTANFGIGLDYNFSSQFQFNLEPTFKYQINTFNNTSGDFNPYFIGVYTGLSFKF